MSEGEGHLHILPYEMVFGCMNGKQCDQIGHTSLNGLSERTGHLAADMFDPDTIKHGFNYNVVAVGELAKPDPETK